LIGCFFPCVYEKLRSDVKDKADYDINELDISNDVKKISLETLIVFMNGDEDKLIDKTNSEKLF
jgi:hypothetical protein